MRNYRLINFLLFVFCLFFAGNTLRSFFRISQREEVIKRIETKLKTLQEENEGLKRKLAEVETKAFIEKEGRDKLNLGKEGEIVVILPPISPFITPFATPSSNFPNWQKWVKLFF